MAKSFLATTILTGKTARLLAMLVMLLGLIAPFVSPATASAAIARGAARSASNAPGSYEIDIDFPAVSEVEVNAGAVLIAHFVAITTVQDIQICPSITGWTEIERVENSQEHIVQQVWSRAITTPQPSSTIYRFRSKAGSCAGANTNTGLLVGLVLYTGVDASIPPVVASAISASDQTTFDAPTTSIQPAGSLVLRFFGINRYDLLYPNDASRVYAERGAVDGNRGAAAFDSILASAGPAGTFTASHPGAKLTGWVATTVVLAGPSAPTDSTAPATTASATSNGAPYTPDIWTNQDVSVTLSAADTGGSGVKEISYSASGGQTIDPVTVAGATTSFTISAEDTTTISYAARDNAGNAETTQTLIVKIDKTAPALNGSLATAPNGNGWYTSDVAIDWSCDDLLSGIVPDSCPAGSTITGEGNNLSASATVTDNAGNQTISSVQGIRIDRTTPVTDVSPVPVWSNGVTVTLTPHDNLSGIAATYYSIDGGEPQTGTSAAFTAEGVYTFAYWSVDLAGNVEAPRTVQVQIDTTAPTISHTLTPDANVNGWHNTPVTVSFVCEDGLSQLAACAGAQTVTAEGSGQNVIGTATDNAGNSATDPVSLNVDMTAPSISASRTPAANVLGWTNSQMIVSFTCTDELSGISTCTTAQTFGEGVGQLATGTATDAAGNVGQTTVANINIDTTAPTIVATATTADGQPYTSGDWTNQPVTVTFVCSDGLSGIISCPAPQVFGDGALQTATGTAFDTAGNSASATIEQINVDTTAPAISASLTTADGQPYTPGSWTNQAVTVSFLCEDALLTIDTCTATQTFGDGAGQSVTGTATDAAGNSASVTVAGINIDMTAPTIAAVASTADSQPYGSGSWTNQAVTVSFACDDGLSGIDACPVPASFGEGVDQAVTGTVFDRAGNSASLSFEHINIDMTPPVIAATALTADGQPYVSGVWTSQAVIVSFSCSDQLSDVVSCPVQQFFSEGSEQTASGAVFDNAGNSASTAIEHINVDTTVPEIVASATTMDGQPYLSGAWTNQPVTVTFTCADTSSGLAGSCPEPVVVGASTAIEGQSVSAQVADLAGNTYSSIPIVVTIDMDAPVFAAVPVDQSVPAAGADGAVVTWVAPSATDAISGQIDPVCTPASGATFRIGVTTVTCTATDAVGNQATASFTVTVTDSQPPLLTVPASITVPAGSPAGANVTFDVIATDASGEATVVCDPASGSLFPVGTTTVNCTATDALGNVGEAGFTVQVQSGEDLLGQLRMQVQTQVPQAYYRLQLMSYLYQAEVRLVLNQPQAAALQLDQFIMRVRQYRGTALPVELANNFIAQAEQIKLALGAGPPAPSR